MQNNDKKYFIPVDGTPIEVSEEVYRAYYQPIWNTRYHAQKNGECRCTKAQLWKCDGVCPGCPFYAAGKKVSIDTPIGGEEDELTLGDTLADDAPSAESILMDKELLDALYDELNRLDPEGKRICELLMYHSEREAADIMGMARSTFKRHWAKIQAELQDKLKEYYHYYVKDNHEAIIDPETFEMVQTLMATRKKGRNRKSSVSIFSSKVKCGDCGSWYGPKVWHSNDAYRKVIWQCNHKFDDQKCATPTLTEDEIKELFLRAANQVIDQKEQFIAIYEQVLSTSLDTTALESELSDLEAEINIAAELIEECIKENAHVALDQAEYQKRYDGLVSRFDKAKARHTEVTDLIAECMARKYQIESYLNELRNRELLTEFRETDWLAMVDFITVHSKKDIRVTFKDGTEIKA